jgi:hypothetical protein
MKKTTLLFVLVVTHTLFAQIVTKNPGDFTSLKVFDQISVQLIPSPESKVEISGNRASNVQVVNKNGELKIKMPLEKLLQGETIEAKVFYQKLETVEASEGSYVISEAPIKTINFSLNAKEGAEIRIALEVQRATIKINSGGKIKVTGTTDNQDIVLTSGGELDAEKFISKQTTINLKAGGDATIFVTDFVDAKVSAGGDIFIHGSPKQINQKILIGGTITEVKR